MAKLFKTIRSARKYHAESGGVLLDFGESGAGYSGSFYKIKKRAQGMPHTQWQQTYGVMEYEEALECRQENGGKNYLDSLIGFDETRKRRLRWMIEEELNQDEQRKMDAVSWK